MAKEIVGRWKKQQMQMSCKPDARLATHGLNVTARVHYDVRAVREGCAQWRLCEESNIDQLVLGTLPKHATHRMCVPWPRGKA